LLAATTLVLSAVYSLWLVKRVIYGPVGNDRVAALQDLNGREFLILATLAIAVLLVGIWPEPLLKMMQPTIHHLVDQAIATKIPL
jgi:NADH-quinone oxidoreductase subunit M